MLDTITEAVEAACCYGSTVFVFLVNSKVSLTNVSCFKNFVTVLSRACSIFCFVNAIFCRYSHILVNVFLSGLYIINLKVLTVRNTILCK